MSAQTTETEVDLLGVIGDAEAAAKGIPFGKELVEFAGAVASRSEADLLAARQALLSAAGEQVLVDAAGTAANFQRMVRIADATGICVDELDTEMGREIREQLNLDTFASASNSLK